MGADTETIILEIKYKDGEVVSRKIKENTDELKKQKQALVSVASGFSTIQITGVATMLAVGTAIKKSYDAFVKQEDATVQMEASLRALGRYTPRVSKEFQDLASSLQRTTRHGDEELLPMFSKLITLGDVQFDQLERVTRAAMDFAVVSGGLESAVDLLAKASVGYTATLSRYGIIIDETIPKNEKFEAVLRLIEGRMGGLEERMAETTGSGVGRLFGALGDLMEQGFVPLAPMVNASAEAMRELALDMADAANEAARLKENMQKDPTLGLGRYAGYGADRFARPSLEDLRSRPPLTGGSPVSSNARPEFTIVMDEALVARIRGNQINAGVATPGRPSMPEIGMPGLDSRGLRPQLDMSGRDPLEVADDYTHRLFFFQNELEKMFETTNQGMSQTASLAQDSALTIADSFAGAFAGMASGSQSAGDAIASAMLGALGQIAIMWGRFHVAQGLAMQFVPGGQVAWGEVAQGMALMALGGTLQGLAGRAGGRGGGGRGGGAGGYGGGSSYSSGSGGNSGNGGVSVFIVAPGGRVTGGGRDIERGLRSAGIEGEQIRTLVQQIKHINRTGTNVARL